MAACLEFELSPHSRAGVSAWLLFRGIAALLAATSLSCDIVKPKDRFFNDQAKLPTFSTIDPSLLRSGQHLAGTVDLALNAASVAGLSIPATVGLYVDDALIMSDPDAPYTFQLNTASAAQGTHLISFQAFESTPHAGLYGIVGLPTLVLSTDVVFDQTPPTPVSLTSVAWDNGSPVLTWTPSTDLNFYAYRITRGGNWGIGGPSPILDQAAVSYRDTTAYPIHGLKIDYTVNVSNRAAEAASNVITLRYGDAVPGLDFLAIGPVTSPTADEFYVISKEPGYDTLKVVSTVSHSTTRMATGLNASGFGVSGDGTRIFVLRYNGGGLRTYDAATLNLLSTVAVPNSVGGYDGLRNLFAVGRPGRAYVHGAVSGVYILDTGTGATPGQIPIDSYLVKLAISPDANALYVATPDSVFRVDVSTDVPAIVLRRATARPIADLQVSPDGLRLYVGHVYAAPSNFVEILDASSLATVGQLSASPGEQLYGFLTTPSYLYLTETRVDPRDPYFQPGRVVQYNRSTLARLRSWDMVQIPSRLGSSRDEQWAYALGSEAWILPATAMPVPNRSLARR